MSGFLRTLIALALMGGVLTGGGIKVRKESGRKHAPDFELVDASGKTVRLSDYAGRVVLLDFWATWCVPCRTEIPWLSELEQKYHDAGLSVIGLSMDEDGWSVVRPFIEKLKVSYPVVIASKRVAYLYGEVDELPLAFFVDRNQRVAAIHLGQGRRDDFERIVGILLDNK